VNPSTSYKRHRFEVKGESFKRHAEEAGFMGKDAGGVEKYL